VSSPTIGARAGAGARALRSIDDLSGPGGLPGLGNALQVRTSQLHLTAERWCREHGPLFRFDLGPRRIVGVGNATAINEILRQRPERFRRWREIEMNSQEMGTKGVFAAEGEDWRRQRRLAVTALNANHLQRYFDVIGLATERLYARLTEAAHRGVPLAIEADFKSFTIDVTTALAFGRDPSAPIDSAFDLRPDIDRVFAMAARRLNSPIRYWRWLKLPADRALERSLARLKLAVGEFVEDARARMHARPELREHPENFLEGMISAQEREGRYSDDELFGNTMTMLLAGEDTTAISLAWTTWFLARHPDVQQQLAAEARELLGDEVLPPSHAHVSQFSYGDAVLREAMRLKPAAVAIVVEALDETAVDDVCIPAGTRLMLLTRYAATQNANFARAEMFDPARWLTSENGARETRSFLAFGAGPRFCPGRNLAFLEGKAALAMLARNFKITLDPTAGPVEERFGFTMAPSGLRVRLEPRVASRTLTPRAAALQQPTGIGARAG
jgi:cytochrome P450